MEIIKFFKKFLYVNLKLFGIIKDSKKVSSKFIGVWPAGNIENIKIGEQVSFAGNVLLHADAAIEIGDNTMIGFQTIFYTSTHDYNDHPMWYKKINRPIKVGKHVWIGTCCIILPGVIIEDYSVIAAGSVVTANVPSGAIVAGNPARIIKYRDIDIYSKSAKIKEWKDGIVINEGHLSKKCKIKEP